MLIEYIGRLAVVVLWLLTAACVLGAAALVPAYLRVHGELTELTGAFATGAQATTSTAAQEARHTIVTITTTRDFLDRIQAAERSSDVLDDALALLPNSIRLMGVSYDRAGRTLAIEAVATDRESAVAYAHTLEERERFTSVDLPIGSLAKRTNIPCTFTATVSGTTTPL